MSLTSQRNAIAAAARAAYIYEKVLEGEASHLVAYLWDSVPEGSDWKRNRIRVAEATILSYEKAAQGGL